MLEEPVQLLSRITERERMRMESTCIPIVTHPPSPCGNSISGNRNPPTQLPELPKLENDSGKLDLLTQMLDKTIEGMELLVEDEANRAIITRALPDLNILTNSRGRPKFQKRKGKRHQNRAPRWTHTQEEEEIQSRGWVHKMISTRPSLVLSNRCSALGKETLQ